MSAPYAVMYLASVFWLLNFTHPFLYWFTMELNLMLFCLSVLSMLASFNNDSYVGVFFYFIIQCGASFVFVFLGMAEELALFSEGGSIFLLFLILFKLGLFPFHFWVYKFCFFMGSMESFMILTFQKIPFLFFFFSLDWLDLCLLVTLSSIVGCFFIWRSKSLMSVLVSSSIYITLWFLFMLYHSISFFLSFFVCYTVFTYKGCLMKAKTMSELNSGGAVVTMVLVGLFLIGLPPLSFFFFKFFLVQNLSEHYSSVFMLVLWILTFGAMLGYFKFFFKFFLASMGERKSSYFTVASVFVSLLIFFFFFF